MHLPTSTALSSVSCQPKDQEKACLFGVPSSQVSFGPRIELKMDLKPQAQVLVGWQVCTQLSPPGVVTLTSGIQDMGTQPLVPGLFKRNGELLGTTFLLFAFMLLRSLCIVGEKKQAL